MFSSLGFKMDQCEVSNYSKKFEKRFELKSCSDFILFNKKVTDKSIVNHLKILAKEKGKTEKEICYDLIIEGVMRDFDRRKK